MEGTLRRLRCFSISILIFSLAATCELTHAKVTQVPSSYCDEVLVSSSPAYVLVPDNANSKRLLHQELYDVSYERKVTRDRCIISRDHNFIIGFHRVTSVSSVLIDVGAFGGAANSLNDVKVSLRRGAKLIECRFSGKIVELSHGRFANFACLSDGAYHSSSATGNAIEISSRLELLVSLANLKVEGSFGWLCVAQRTTKEPVACLRPGLYPGQILKPNKQFYRIGETVSFSCPEDFVINQWNAQRITCQENGEWSDSTPICQPRRQWWKSIIKIVNNQESPQFAKKKNISIAAYFNENFRSITEITIDFTVEFDSSEWKRYFMEDNNAIFHVVDADNNVLKTGTLPFHESTNARGSVTVPVQDLVQSPCKNCSVALTFRNYHWEVPIVKAIRIYGSTFSHQQGANTDEKHGPTQCPPITPYIGMPDAFKRYELVVNSSINDLLLASPCREGFKFVGKRSEINQCKHGAWQGDGFPICEEIRAKTPPEVEHATWVYVTGNGQHEVIYMCQKGYYATDDGKAIYSIENDDWINIPQCEPLQDTIQHQQAIVAPIVVAALLALGLLAIIAYFIYGRRFSKTRQSKKGDQLTSDSASDDENISE